MIENNITHIFEPTPLQCGQAVLAMVTGADVEKIVELCGTENETDLKTMKRVLELFGISVSPTRKEISDKKDLPNVALLSLETPKCWHWSLFFDGKFYDSNLGVMDSYDMSQLLGYLEVKVDQAG